MNTVDTDTKLRVGQTSGGGSTEHSAITDYSPYMTQMEFAESPLTPSLTLPEKSISTTFAVSPKDCSGYSTNAIDKNQATLYADNDSPSTKHLTL